MSSLDNVTSISLCAYNTSDYQKILNTSEINIYGECEQTGSPTPSNPVPITCNNGILGIHKDLPLGYTRLKYIQNNASTRIDTGVLLDVDDVKLEVSVQNASTGSWYILQSRNTVNNNYIYGISGSSTNQTILAGLGLTNSSVSIGPSYTSINRNTSTDLVINFTFKAGTSTIKVIDPNNMTIYTDSTTYDTSSFSPAQNNVCIFGNKRGDFVGANNQLLYAKIYKSGQLVFNGIPAKRDSDSAIGIYNTISDQFLVPETGSVTAGSVMVGANGTQEVIKDAYVFEYTVKDDLLGIDSTYRDKQLFVRNVSTPYAQLIKNVEALVLDGTETWQMVTIGLDKKAFSTQINELDLASASAKSTIAPYGCTSNNYAQYDHGCFVENHGLTFITTDNFSDVNAWKAYLASSYANDTPVIAVCQLNNPVITNMLDNTFMPTYLPIQIESSLSNPEITYTTTGMIVNGVYTGNSTITSVDLRDLPWINNSMYNAFSDCINLTSVTNINNDVTNLNNTFSGCDKLVTGPILPTSATSMNNTFYYCDSLVTPSVIPSNVTDMTETFSHCFNLTTMPNLPSAVTNMLGTFYQCYNLRIINDLIIPSNVTNMMSAFYDACRGLTQIRDITIPNSVINMKQAFQYFGGTTNASGVTARTIDIGTGVTNMNSTFNGCILSATTFNIRSLSVTDATNCFRNTTGYNRPNGTLYVHVPANSTTYNSFVAAGYSTTTLKDEVLLVADL